MPEIPVLPCKGVKIYKNHLEKCVVFNSQNYNGYPLSMALTLPGVYVTFNKDDVTYMNICKDN